MLRTERCAVALDSIFADEAQREEAFPERLGPGALVQYSAMITRQLDTNKRMVMQKTGRPPRRLSSPEADGVLSPFQDAEREF